jgi:hypothetical protein
MDNARYSRRAEIAWASRVRVTQLCTGTACLHRRRCNPAERCLARTSLELITERRVLPRSLPAGYPRALQPAVREQVPARAAQPPAGRRGMAGCVLLGWRAFRLRTGQARRHGALGAPACTRLASWSFTARGRRTIPGGKESKHPVRLRRQIRWHDRHGSQLPVRGCPGQWSPPGQDRGVGPARSGDELTTIGVQAADHRLGERHRVARPARDGVVRVGELAVDVHRVADPQDRGVAVRCDYPQVALPSLCGRKFPSFSSTHIGGAKTRV